MNLKFTNLSENGIVNRLKHEKFRNEIKRGGHPIRICAINL